MTPPSWLPASVAPVFSRLTTLSPGLALAAGGAAVLFGGALWRFVAVGSGLAIGGWAGWQVGAWAHNPQVGWVAAIVGGIGLAVIFHLVERLALAGLGGAIAVELAAWLWPLAQQGPADAVVLGVAGLVGMVIAALLHHRAIQALSAVAGATLVAWAVGYPGNPALIAGLGVFGAWFQGRGRSAPAPKKKKGK